MKYEKIKMLFYFTFFFYGGVVFSQNKVYSLLKISALTQMNSVLSMVC